MDLSSALDYPTISGAAPRRIHLLVRMETWPEEGGAERKPLNLALAIDRSGSMQGGKLEATKAAALALVERLTPRDVFSLVTFESRVEVVIPPGPVTDLEVIRRRIRAIESAGGTNLSGGWLRSLAFASERHGPECLSRVLLLTDGQANEGVTERAALAEIARQHRQEGVVTTTLGFGTDFNEGDLTAVAEAGAGHFYFIDSPEKMSAAFLQEFGELARVFGQNCEMCVTPAEGVPAPEILGGLAATSDGRTQTVAFGDVRDRDLKQMLAAFSLPAGLAPGTREIAAVHVRYDAVRGKVGTRRHVLSVKVDVAAEGAEAAEPNPDVRREVVWAEAGRLKRQALARLDGGDAAGAYSDLQSAAELLARDRALDPDTFEREEENLRALAREAMEGGAALRKALAAQAFDLRGQRGAYASAPTNEVRAFAMTPKTPELLDDIADHLRTTLAGFGYDDGTLRKLEYALRELVENALEHGCREQANPRVDVELHLGRNYAKVVVKDTGPGFDFAGTLAREEREAEAPQAKKRGRGLISVKRGVESLTANAAGNEIAASIRRRAGRLSQQTETLLSMAGVGEVPVIKVRGFLDSQSFVELEQRINDLLDRNLYRIIVDLKDCDYISSAGAGVFIGAIGTTHENDGNIILVCPSSNVREVLDMLGLSQIFTFAASVEEARRIFEEGG